MPETARFALRLPPELYEALQALATRDRRSINGEIVYILDQYVEEQGQGTVRASGGNVTPGKIRAAA